MGLLVLLVLPGMPGESEESGDSRNSSWSTQAVKEVHRARMRCSACTCTLFVNSSLMSVLLLCSSSSVWNFMCWYRYARVGSGVPRGWSGSERWERSWGRIAVINSVS